MHVITRRKLLEASAKHAELAGPLDLWFRIVKRAKWKNLDDTRKDFPTADGVGKFTVFNIKGNRFRLIVEINYLSGRVYIRYVVTHAEYSKGSWKK